jgi:hypothetical protein
MLRSNKLAVRPRARSSNWSRVSTRCGRSRNATSRSNSVVAQIDQRFCRRVELPPRHMETPAGELEYAAAFGWRIRIGHDRPPQHRPNPGEQLARIEGLREIVIGPHLEPDDPVGFPAPRREHNDWHGAAGPQPATQGQASSPGIAMSRITRSIRAVLSVCIMAAPFGATDTR